MAVSCGKVAWACESLPCSELHHRFIVRLDIPENGKSSGQRDHRDATQFSLR
jgi:hypothetical protein